MVEGEFRTVLFTLLRCLSYAPVLYLSWAVRPTDDKLLHQHETFRQHAHLSQNKSKQTRLRQTFTKNSLTSVTNELLISGWISRFRTNCTAERNACREELKTPTDRNYSDICCVKSMINNEIWRINPRVLLTGVIQSRSETLRSSVRELSEEKWSPGQRNTEKRSLYTC